MSEISAVRAAFGLRARCVMGAGCCRPARAARPPTVTPSSAQANPYRSLLMPFRDPRLANVSPHATCRSGRHSRARLRSGPGPGRLRPGGRHVRAGPGDQRRNPGHQHRHPDRQHTLPAGVLASDPPPGHLVTVASLRAGPLLAPVGSHGAPLPGLRSTGPGPGRAAIRALSDLHAVCTRPPCRLHTSRLSCCSRQMTGLTSSRCAASGSRCAASGRLRKAEERRCPERQRRGGSTRHDCR
jgi:hypothetical protein